jgi:S-DNA-T family DNA segregation ATPase FtsK/SpoIIIE
MKLPPLDLLEPAKFLDPSERMTEDELVQSSKTLVEKLGNFAITGRVTEVHPGPVITLFELEPDPGVRISQIVSRADDVSLALRARSLRIVAPLPGRGTVGFELPNRVAEVVSIRDVVSHDVFQRQPSRLTFALGKSISGDPVTADLARMPHLLVAGATGSGKSVCVNSIITSILLRARPTEVRFVLIDPKVLELTMYNGIPHLLSPVVTDPHVASRALKWVVVEMERRYKVLAKVAVRSIADFNKKVAKLRKEAPPEERDEIPSPLPFIVVVVDELADLMMTVGGDIEDSIARLAQMARAVGIHLVVATQRPSVDVITGIIKANFPSRIAFQVASKVDSRTILDKNGAESLLGRGDMLFVPQGKPEPERVHGCFISTEEVEQVAEFWRAQVPDDLDDGSLEFEEQDDGDALPRDELFEKAARLVIIHQQGSATLLQRRLQVGYSRASRLVDQLEEAGIVGPHEGSKARRVLVDEEGLDAILAGAAPAGSETPF